MASPAAVVFASFKPHPDRADDLRAALDIMIEHTRQEPGCEFYDLYSSGEGNELRYHLFERYKDDEALEAHRAADYYKDYRAKLPDLLEVPVEVAVLREVDVAG
jgi:quinol monooxygenase YgiN